MVPSTASAAIGQCSAGYMCSCEDASYSGGFVQGNSVGQYPSAMHDRASSLYNNASRAGTYYSDAYYTGMTIRLNSGQVWDNLYWNTLINDKIDSHRRD
ncbi:hypothetical protein BKA12_001871 [Neomicrococcus lactis]|uniref:Uncharacterized protein n=1 Tax=Neomicrococcus lactis TaxID=732241 RepID=A0A7W9DC51_9MICC|nr:hypothetical protein [Neomicrococcus lactis]